MKLGEFVDVNMGQSPIGDSLNETDGIEFHQGKIFFGELDLDVSPIKTTAPAKCAKPGDVLICVRAPVGVVNITDRVICIGRGLAALTPKDDMPERFLLHLLRYHKKVFEGIATGSTFASITTEQLKNIDLSLPPLPVQRRIAGVLGAIDEKIAVNRRKIAELEALAKTVYDYWFVQFDFPDAHGRPYRSSGGKMTWNAALKRDVPEGWGSCAIGELCNCHDSKRIPLSGKQRSEMQGKIPYYGATGVMDRVNKHIFDGEFLLFAEDGSVMTDDGCPILQIINGMTWVNNHTHVLSPQIKCSVKFLQLHFQSIPVRKIKTGSIQPKVTKENLFSFRVLSIPQSVLGRVDDTFEALQKNIEILNCEVEELTSQREALREAFVCRRC